MSRGWAATSTALRASAPLALGVVLGLLSLLPYAGTAAELAAPHFTLALVYYWTIHRPQLVPPLAVAALGLFQDLLWGGPPGLNMLLLLTAQSVLANQEAFFTRRSFAVGWAGFIVVLAIAMAVQWAAASLYYTGEPAWGPLAEQGLLTAAVYPVLGWMFGALDRFLYR